MNQINKCVDKWGSHPAEPKIPQAQLETLKKELNKIATSNDVIQEHFFKGIKNPVIIDGEDFIPTEILREKIEFLYSKEMEKAIREKLVFAESHGRIKVGEWRNFVDYDMIPMIKEVLVSLLNSEEEIKDD